MTTSNRQLIKNLLTGRHNNFTDKKANSMMIREKDGYTILEGYGHALYGLKKGGTVILFDDWYGYSSTTSSHLNRLRGMAKSDEHINLIEDEEIS